MKYLKSIIAAFFFLMLGYGALSQNPVFTKGDFSVHIENFLHQKQSVKYDTLCIRSCAFISFVIMPDGKVDSILCNTATPKALAALFKDAVKSTNGLWTAVAKQRLLLPIAYLLECKRNRTVIDKTQQSILQMLDFSGKSKKEAAAFFNSEHMDMLNCIILKPVFFRSPIN